MEEDEEVEEDDPEDDPDDGLLSEPGLSAEAFFLYSSER